jgi:hypothetical protein
MKRFIKKAIKFGYRTPNFFRRRQKYKKRVNFLKKVKILS